MSQQNLWLFAAVIFLLSGIIWLTAAGNAALGVAMVALAGMSAALAFSGARRTGRR